ncbi:FG-GAP-like repeat-containing protein [Streptomyces sp. ET3-23]|uniref:FG-GAP-like repeat-containing protein n=1 Tax=Streptomyces sp. ET3-23 TaxID=2885643 RepID=UPI001D123182|nr:FG-GAP-like repeat-containing protein [Streptomyces sp. ET3-23]MCC2277224.1 FG-GAP-like repeat-containing protein [Streptomyces sp. ET3-23]
MLAGTPAYAVAGGDEAKDGRYAFTAKLDIGNGKRSCSATLVDQQWLITAASCFADDPAQGFKITPGVPKLTTVATIGRTDLNSSTGDMMPVTELIPREDRDLVMARLAKPIAGVAPLALATDAPAKDDVLQAAGFGRTKDEWVPDRLHTAAFSVDSVKDTTVGLTGKSADAALCKGDTGGPAFREKDGRLELAAVNSTSWQGGCFGTDESETRKGAVDTRVDDINAWIQQVRSVPQGSMTVAGDFDGDGKQDVAMLVDYGQENGRNKAALWMFPGSGELRAPRTVWESTDGWNWASSKLVAGDFNGDGKTDIAVLYNYGQVAPDRNQTGLWVFANNGHGFDKPNKVWESTGSWNWNASMPVAGDFNGDGKADIAVLYNYGQVAPDRNGTGLWQFMAKGDGTFAEPRMAWDSRTADNGRGSWNWNASKVVAGDFNGDHKTDVGVLYNYGTQNGFNQTGLWVFPGTDAAATAPVRVWANSPSMSWNWNASTPVAGDFNGDGKADLGILYGYEPENGRNKTALWTLTSTGAAFDPKNKVFNDPSKVWESTGSWNWASSTPFTGDFNGDGKTDVEVLYNYGAANSGRKQLRLWTFSSTGDGFAAPLITWDNSVPRDDVTPAQRAAEIASKSAEDAHSNKR